MGDIISIETGGDDSGFFPEQLEIGFDFNNDGINEIDLSLYDQSGTDLPDRINLDVDWNSDGSENAGIQLDASESQSSTALWMDYNDDGKIDIEASSAAATGDFTPNVPNSIEMANEIWGDTLEPLNDLMPAITFNDAPIFDTLDTAIPGFNEIWATYGNPHEDMALWDGQDDPFSCAVATTNMMFRSLGFDPGEAILSDIMQDYGVYNPYTGTTPNLLTPMLNDICTEAGLDISASDFHWNTAEDLAEILESGARPLLAIDATELYAEESIPLHELGLLPDSGHAVQLIGLTVGPDGPIVTLNDPDVGPGIEVPFDRLFSAGDDFGFHGVALS